MNNDESYCFKTTHGKYLSATKSGTVKLSGNCESSEHFWLDYWWFPFLVVKRVNIFLCFFVHTYVDKTDNEFSQWSSYSHETAILLGGYLRMDCKCMGSRYRCCLLRTRTVQLCSTTQVQLAVEEFLDKSGMIDAKLLVTEESLTFCTAWRSREW